MQVVIYVSNDTDYTVSVSSHINLGQYVTEIVLPPRAKNVMLDSMPYDGLCSPPDRWLPYYYKEIRIEFPDGRCKRIGRDEFLDEAEFRSHWFYTIREHRDKCSASSQLAFRRPPSDEEPAVSPQEKTY